MILLFTLLFTLPTAFQENCFPRELVQEQTSSPPPPGYAEGPHKLISDSLYSLIIFIYVSITFLYMFYAFCWREQVTDTRREKGHYVIVEDQEPGLVI